MVKKFKRVGELSTILASTEMQKFVSDLAEKVAGNVSDPNPLVRDTLRTQVYITTSRKARTATKRAVGQVGIAPYLIGVEAKRGALARALGATRG